MILAAVLTNVLVKRNNQGSRSEGARIRGPMVERFLRVERLWSWRTFFLQWEWLLVLIFVAVNIVNSTLSPYYFSADTFLQTPMSFLDMAFLVLPMTMVIILGNIDISVGSTVALSAVIMAVAYNAGLAMPLAVVLCLLVASASGFINGILMTRFKSSPRSS